jgi:hypothetical protein
MYSRGESAVPNRPAGSLCRWRTRKASSAMGCLVNMLTTTGREAACFSEVEVVSISRPTLK